MFFLIMIVLRKVVCRTIPLQIPAVPNRHVGAVLWAHLLKSYCSSFPTHDIYYITLHFHKVEKALALRWYLVVGYNSAS